MNTPDDAAAVQDNASQQSGAEHDPPRWQPLSRLQRRVAGVLVEKSKTTPDVYPMSLNGVKTACNQKSNRSPKMDLREEQVEETLYELRHMGAVIEVHSGGRVPKFKHQLYEWLGVNQVELAVMAELLLRGEQSLGDLRARAARMDEIAGMNELKPIVAGLIQKNLIVELTPPGRGQIVTHHLYQPDELAKLKAEYGDHVSTRADDASERLPVAASSAEPPPEMARPSGVADDRLQQLVADVDELKQVVQSLQAELATIRKQLN